MKNNAVLLAIGIGAFLGVVVTCGGMGAGFLWIVHRAVQNEFETYLPYSEITDVDYALTGPASITLGDAATFVLQVTNVGTNHHVIHSLDFYTDLVGQGTVTVSPTPTTLFAPPGECYGNAIFDLPLPPGATQRFDVTFTPTIDIEYSVNIDVNIGDRSGAITGYIERFHDLSVLPRNQ